MQNSMELEKLEQGEEIGIPAVKGLTQAWLAYETMTRKNTW